MKSGYSTDLFLLKKFQGVSDWMQHYFGYDNFTIAKLLRTIMIVLFVARESISFKNVMDPTEIIIMVCSVMLILKIEFMLRKAQKSIKNKHEVMNSAVLEYATSRVLIQFVAIAALGFFVTHIFYIVNSTLNTPQLNTELKDAYWDIFGILLFLVAYFSSCTPKPYKPGKLKKRILLIPKTVVS